MRFLAGFLVASALWGAGVLYAYSAGFFGHAGPVEPSPQAALLEPEPSSSTKKPRRRKLRADSGPSQRGDKPGEVGSDVGWDETQQIDMEAGEQKLSGAQIEAGFDGAMQRIRRCLVLVPTEGELQGELTFGMRVGSDGKAKAVQLSGPPAVTAGESGACLRAAAQGIQFATFDGPDTLFKFPVTLR